MTQILNSEFQLYLYISLSKVTVVMFDKTGTITRGQPQVTNVWISAVDFNPLIILAALGYAEKSSEHPIAFAIARYVDEVFGREITGKSEAFQAVPGCGMKCTVSALGDIIKSSQNSSELRNFISYISTGSSGKFQLNDIELEITNTQNMKLGNLIGANMESYNGVDAKYTVIIGNREWMNRNGMIIKEDVNRRMNVEEEQGRSAVLCAINGE